MATIWWAINRLPKCQCLKCDNWLLCSVSCYCKRTLGFGSLVGQNKIFRGHHLGAQRNCDAHSFQRKKIFNWKNFFTLSKVINKSLQISKLRQNHVKRWIKTPLQTSSLHFIQRGQSRGRRVWSIKANAIFKTSVFLSLVNPLWYLQFNIFKYYVFSSLRHTEASNWSSERHTACSLWVGKISHDTYFRTLLLTKCQNCGEIAEQTECLSPKGLTSRLATSAMACQTTSPLVFLWDTHKKKSKLKFKPSQIRICNLLT